VDSETRGALHHIELWVPDLQRANDEWGWLLSRLGYETYQTWNRGISWRLGPTYIVVEESPDLSGFEHQRTAPGMNHLAFHAGSHQDVDSLARECTTHGWSQLFADKYPNAGGPGHYAAYLVNSDGYEVELVARA
jgi:catechol 2,3-dioxygenase-like lactoylglutathione lyase family enzyme